MNLRKMLRSGAMAFAVMGAMFLSSCGSDSSKIVKNIPADALVVVNFNIEQVLENGGCKVDNGKITLSKQLKDALAQTEGGAMIQPALAYLEGIDLSAVSFFVTEIDGEEVPVGIIALSDPSKVKKNLESFNMTPVKHNDYEVIDFGGEGGLVFDNNLLWIVGSFDNLDAIKKAAKKNSIADNKNVAEYLSQGNALDVYVSIDKAMAVAHQDVPVQLKNHYVCGSLELKGQSLMGECLILDKDGNAMPFTSIADPVDTSFLSTVPTDGNIQVIALGKPGNMLSQLLNAGAQQMGQEGLLLSGINGTIAMLIDTTVASQYMTTMMLNGNYTLPSESMMVQILSMCKAALMAQYTPAAESQIMQMLNGLLDTSNIAQNLTTGSNGLRSFTINDIDVSCGPMGNGFLGVTNMPVGNYTPDRDLVKAVEGKSIVLYSRSMPGTASQFGADFGSEAIAALESDRAVFNVTLIGTSENFMEAMITMCLNPTFQSFFKTILEQAFNEYNNYDSYYYDDYSYEEPEEFVEDYDFVDYDA